MELKDPQGGSLSVRLSVFDRLVSWINPVRGVERMKARSAMALAGGGYQAGRRDRRALRRFRPKQNSANADIIPDLPDLRSRSRDLVRNVPLASGAVATTVTNVVGDGLTLQSAIDRETLGLDEEEAKRWQRQAEAEFALFCQSADFTMVQPFQELQALVFRAILESGDVLVVRRWRNDRAVPYATRLQVIEADRLANRDRVVDRPDLVAGVKYDADGVVVGWQIASRHPDDTGLNGAAIDLSWIDVPSRDPVSGRPLGLHLYDRLRPDQARGVPWLAPAIELFKTLSDYSEAEVRAAVISAMFTAFITTPPRDANETPVVGSSSTQDVSDPNKEIRLEDAGAIVELDPGQEVDIANPGRPNPVFDQFVMSVLRQVGVALELPFEVLVKHFTASYSASRAALEMAWQFFRRRRFWLARRFCQPVYEWAIEEAVARGRLKADGFFDDPLKRRAWLRASWIGPGRISLDPLKDANAHKVNIETGLESRSEVIAERGGDPDAVFEQQAAEARRRSDAGMTAVSSTSAAETDEPADKNDQEDERT